MLPFGIIKNDNSDAVTNCAGIFHLVLKVILELHMLDYEVILMSDTESMERIFISQERL